MAFSWAGEKVGLSDSEMAARLDDETVSETVAKLVGKESLWAGEKENVTV